MNARSRLVAVALAAIVLVGWAALCAVVLFSDVGMVQADSMQVIASGPPNPSLSATETAVAATVTAPGGTNQSSSPGFLAPPITIVASIINAVAAVSLAIIAFKSYKGDKEERRRRKAVEGEERIRREFAEEERRRAADEQQNEIYVDKFINELKKDMEKFLSLKVKDGNKGLREVYRDWEDDWREVYITRRATCGGQQTKTYIDAAIQKQSDINTIIRLEQKRPEPNIIGEVQENGRLRILTSVFKKNAKKRWLLIGGPGTGKTICLKKIALDVLSRLLAREALPQDKSSNLSDWFESHDLPIYVECKEFVRFSQTRQASGSTEDELFGNELYEFIAFTWEEKYKFPRKNALDYIDRQVRAGKALFLLDGLDEAPLKEDHNQEVIEYNQVIRDLLEDIPFTVPVIITVRGPLDSKSTLASYPGLVDFTPVIIENLTSEDMWSFLNTYLKKFEKDYKETYGTQNGDRTGKTVRTKWLKTALGNNPRLQAFAATPLSLLLLLVLFTEEVQLPLRYRCADIYKHYVDLLFGSWDEAKEVEPDRLQPEQQKLILAHLAWYLHTHNCYSCDREKMLRVIQKSLNEMQSNVTGERAFVELMLKSGFIKEDVENTEPKKYYRFTSIPLQEYFAAQYILIHEKKVKTLFSNQNHPWWEEVILLYIQYASNTQHAANSAMSLLETLAGVNEDWSTPPTIEALASLLLAGRALASTEQSRVASTDQFPVVVATSPQSVTATATLPQPVVAPQPLPEETLRHKIRMRLYHLLWSAETPMFIQEQIAKTFAEMGIKYVSEENLSQLTTMSPIKSPLEEGLDDARLYLEGMVRVSPLLLPVLHQCDNSLREQIMKFDSESISESDLLALLKDKKDDEVNKENGSKLDSVVDALTLMRRRMVHAFCTKEGGDVPRATWMLCNLLSNSDIAPEIRACMAYALGIFGDQSVACKLLSLLKDKTIPENVNTRPIYLNIVTALGKIASRSLGTPSCVAMPDCPVASVCTAITPIARTLLQCLDPDNRSTYYIRDEYVRWNIVATLIHILHEDSVEVAKKLNEFGFSVSIILSWIRALKYGNDADFISQLRSLAPSWREGEKGSPEHGDPDKEKNNEEAHNSPEHGDPGEESNNEEAHNSSQQESPGENEHSPERHYQKEYIWICEVLEKLTMDMQIVKELKESWKPPVSEFELVESLSRLEWAAMRGEYIRNIKF
jgi:hypothetical protein